MTQAEILDHLRKLTPSERLEVAEAAMRLTREDLTSSAAEKNVKEDPVLNVAGCLSGNPLSAAEIEQQLYGE